MYRNLSYDTDLRLYYLCYSLFSTHRVFIGIASLLMILILFMALILLHRFFINIPFLTLAPKIV